MQVARQELLLALHLLLLMRNANEKAGRRIQASEFYNTEVSEKLNLEHEYLAWLRLEVLNSTNQAPQLCSQSASWAPKSCMLLHVGIAFSNVAASMVPCTQLSCIGANECCSLMADFRLRLQLNATGVQDQKRRKQQGASDGTELVSVCQTAFCLTPQAKSKILQIEAFMQKQAHFQSGSMQVRTLPPVSMFLAASFRCKC